MRVRMTEAKGLVLVLALLTTLAYGCRSGDVEAPDRHGEDRSDLAGDAVAHDEHEGEGDEDTVELGPLVASRIEIRAVPVEERTLAGILETTGHVDFDRDRLAHVSPRISGRVHTVSVTLGDRVQPGQTLAVIDSIELGRAKSELLRARAELDLARQTLAREQSLLQDRITSEQSVLEARSAYRLAETRFQAATRELRLLGVSADDLAKAPADDASTALSPLSSSLGGTVVEKHVTLGEVVSPEDNLFTIADLSHVWIWIDVYEGELARVHLDDHVAVRVEAYPEHVFEGVVTYIRNQVDPETRTVRARLDVANVDRHLRPGMFATVTITDPHTDRDRTATRARVVPTSAIQRDGDEEVVFVRVAENRYERRPITSGRRTEAFTEVVDGLATGESVVVEGTFLLKSELAKHRIGGGHDH